MDATKSAGFEITESDDKVRFPRRPLSDQDTLYCQKDPLRQKFLTKFPKN